MSEAVRIAPSPTGFLHIGVTRAALFNYLYSRKYHARFLIRIEDTDLERSREEYTISILEGLKWLGIESDAPLVKQSERIDFYLTLINRMLAEKTAYRCDCSKERLEEIRAIQMAEGKSPKYDGHCRNRSDVRLEGSVVRLKSPQEGSILVEDPVYGTYSFDNQELDDFVILKSDGIPTYQFAVVADDHDMGVTLVIRGNDLFPSTPKQIALYQALGWTPPRFAHLPMILGKDKQKLSKRHGATALLAYRALGFVPQAMRNYLVRLGWAYGDQEIFTLEEMIEKFSLEGIGKSPAIFDMEKLLWVNGEHIRRMTVKDLTDTWLDHLSHLAEDCKYLEEGTDTSFVKRGLSLDPQQLRTNRSWLESVVASCQERSHTLVQLTDHAWPFLNDQVEYDPKAIQKNFKPEARQPLERIRDWILGMDALTDENAIHDYLVRLAEELGLNLGKVAQPLRVAVTGVTISPPINVTLCLLGRERVLDRIEKAIGMIQS